MPVVPRQRICSWHRLVHGIGPAAPAKPADGGQTLLRCCEPAIRGPSLPEIVIGTPHPVLRHSGFFKANESGKHAKDEHEIPHGNLLVIPIAKPGQKLISRIEPTESVDTARGS